MSSVFEKPQWRHPIRTIKSFFTSIKWAWQRATRGYCERDLWSVSDWFLSTLPNMLEDAKTACIGYPVELEEREWNEILSQLTFLLREANENTCSKVNPYKEEYHRISEEFREKYGELGEKLMSDEDKKKEKETGYSKLYLPSHLPEYKEICALFSEEERKLNGYREQCKNEALELFSKWFYNLRV